MELTNEFRVAIDPASAWTVLTDVERIAPCMPGAQLQEIEGDEYRGIVKVKVGPITAQYKGAATFIERDEANRKAVLRAEGRETRGQGNANATITATLEPDGDGTRVVVVTDLTVTGKVAQFGRGVMADVSAKLLDQFVASLETTVLAGDSVAVDAAAVGVPDGSVEENTPPLEKDAAPQPPPAVRVVDHPEPQPVDLVQSAGAPVAKRVTPILALLAVGWVISLFVRRRRRRGR